MSHQLKRKYSGSSSSTSSSTTEEEKNEIDENLLAERGREAIAKAEGSMIGLMECRRRHSLLQPLYGARIVGYSVPDLDANHAVLIETLIAFGAEVQWATAGSIWNMKVDPAVVSALKLKGVSFYPFKPDTVSTDSSELKILEFPFGKKPNLLLDPYGTLTHAMCKMSLHNEIDGIVESRNGLEDLLDPHHLEMLNGRMINFDELMQEAGEICCNYNRCEKSLVQFVKEFTDKKPAPDNVCVVVGYHSWIKSCARALRYAGITVMITENDPALTFEAGKDGFKRATLEQAYQLATVFVIGTELPKIDLENLNKMKGGSLVCTITCCSPEKANEVEGFDGYLADFMLHNGKHVQILEYSKKCENYPLTKSFEYTLQLLALMEVWEKWKRDKVIIPADFVLQATLLHLPGLAAGQDGNLSNSLANDLIIYKYPKHIRITKIPHFSSYRCAHNFL